MQIAHQGISPDLTTENVVLVERKPLEEVKKHLFEKVNLPGSRQKVYSIKDCALAEDEIWLAILMQVLTERELQQRNESRENDN
jgi:hypothetical protein